MKNKKVRTLLVIYIALLSIIIRGYSFGLGDQVIHLPLLYKTQNFYLFPNDYLFKAGQENLTLFYSLLANMTSLAGNTEQILFVIYLLLMSFYFYVISILSQHFFKGKLVWFFSILLFITPVYIGGAAITTVETMVAPRTIGNLLSLLVLLLLLRRKILYSFIILGIEFLFHPLSALYIAIILYSHLFFVERIKIARLVAGSLLLIIVTLPLLPSFSNQLSSYIESFNMPTWLNILKERNTYAFPHLWNIGSWITLTIGVTPVLIYLINTIRIGRKNTYALLTMFNIVVISFTVFIIQYIFTSAIPLTVIIKLQLGRILYFPVFLSLLSVAYYLERFRIKLNIDQKFTVTILVLTITVFSVISLSSFIEEQPRKWKEVQTWANRYTSSECIFLTPFHSEGFRVYSKRSTTGEYKDGTLSFYSWDFAKNWNDRMTDLNFWEHDNEEMILGLQKKYDFSFVVVENNYTYDFKLRFSNKSYRVYEMPVLQKGCQVI